MRILHLIKTSEGADWAINLMTGQKNACPDIFLVAVLPSGGKNYLEYKNICDRVYEFDFKIGFTIFKNGPLLRKIVEEEKPDVVHSWFTQTTLYARLYLRKLKIPRVFQVVGPLHLENKLFKWADVLSANQDDYWIATSHYIYHKYKSSGISETRLFLNYVFIDTAHLLQGKDKVNKRDFRKEFNIPACCKMIGTASYIYPPRFYEKTGVKGHEYLLKAFETLLSKRKDVVLIIAGATFGKANKYLASLKNKASAIDSDRIFFTGKYAHVYEVLSNLDVFIYLSKSENLGGVYESLLFEIPTVSSNRGALPELVIDGISGYLVDIGNNTEIVKHISHALDNRDEQMIKKGKEQVLATFRKERTIEESLNIYHQVIKT